MALYASPEWTDDILLDLIRLEDDRAAFSELYLRYWKVLTNIAYKRLKSEETAEEAVQNVFISLFLRRQTLQLTTTLEAYLKTALKYQTFKTYRAQQLYYRHLDEMIAGHDIEPPSADQMIDNKILRARIYEVAEKMPEKCREVFLMSRFEQLSHQDIADKLDISVSTVKKHITKAMNILRQEFKNHQLDFLTICFFFALCS